MKKFLLVLEAQFDNLHGSSIIACKALLILHSLAAFSIEGDIDVKIGRFCSCEEASLLKVIRKCHSFVVASRLLDGLTITKLPYQS